MTDHCCQGPQGPHTKSFSETRADGIRTLEALRDKEQSAESRAVLERIIKRIKDTPLLIDISARELNFLHRRKGRL